MNIELIRVGKDNRKEFVKFFKDRQTKNPLRRDTLSGLVKDILYGRSALCGSAYLEPVMVKKNGTIVMVCILAHAVRMPEYLQISFLESQAYHQEAFGLIMGRAEELAMEKGACRISGSLNVHVNYGLGFLAGDYHKEQSFGLAHNESHYHKYFEETGFHSVEMVTYSRDMATMQFLFDARTVNRIQSRYKVRQADFSRFKDEISLYTKINNEAFSEHLFYYPRIMQEDLELFNDLKFLLKPENLLFVMKNEIPVGFMLWYPDFCKLMKPGETVGLATVLRNRLFYKKIRNFKIVEMGVIPGEGGRGAALALMEACFALTKGKFDWAGSGWILADNFRSRNFGIKWGDEESGHFKAYVKDLTR